MFGYKSANEGAVNFLASSLVTTTTEYVFVFDSKVTDFKGTYVNTCNIINWTKELRNFSVRQKTSRYQSRMGNELLQWESLLTITIDNDSKKINNMGKETVRSSFINGRHQSVYNTAYYSLQH